MKLRFRLRKQALEDILCEDRRIAISGRLFAAWSIPFFCVTIGHLGPPAVESSIAVEDAVENRGLYRVFCFALVFKGF